jgi:NAD(P)-dependent dehydrogenase (short-subunit alcohol dehydrogenase family)
VRAGAYSALASERSERPERRAARQQERILDVNGVSAIVTGGASGLGGATSRLLAQRGARVVIVDMKDDEGSKLAGEIGGAFCHADVADEADVIAAVDTAGELGPLRALVNCAGIGWATRTIGKDGQYESAHDLGVFRKVIEVNLIGTFNCIRLAATAMSRLDPLADGERGAIVNTASVAAYDGQIGQAAYSASKGGVVGMTLPVARDLSAVGIRVNTIAPGLIDTPIYGQGDASEAFKEKLRAGVLFPKRLGTADEFASLAIELLTNGYMNGEDIRLDGGIRMPPK